MNLLVPHLHIKILGKSFNSFKLFAGIGVFISVLLGVSLTILSSLSISIILVLTAISLLTFISLAYFYKIITGRDDLVYYQHEIAILITTTLALWLLNKPILPYLDISILAIGVVLAFGRLGCLSVGCCHGKPCKLGIIYSKAHEEAGFPFYYTGVKVFPIQLLESICVFGIVIIGIFIWSTNYPSGTVLIFYSVVYGLIRFIFEFFRGDPERPHFLGFSEAQWTTCFLLLLAAILAYFKILPFYVFHSIVAIGMLIGMISVIGIRRIYGDMNFKIFGTQHLREIAEGIDIITEEMPIRTISNTSDVEVPMINTCLGLVFSGGKVKIPQGLVYYYSLSSNNEKIILKDSIVKKIAKQLTIFRHRTMNYEIIQGYNKVFHILFKN